jgi:hypothetical protein
MAASIGRRLNTFSPSGRRRDVLNVLRQLLAELQSDWGEHRKVEAIAEVMDQLPQVYLPLRCRLRCTGSAY